MKKIFIISLLWFVLMPLSAMEGEVISVQGKAEIKQAEKWVPAKVGNKVKTGDMISTGFKSELTLKIDGSVITVKPMTRLKVEEIAQKNEAVASEVYLNVGSVKADVKPASTKKVEFKVKTPVATASVRGTSGEISSDGLLVGTSGTWSYININGVETKVNMGDSVIISDTGKVTGSQSIKQDNTQAQVVKTLAESEANSQSLSTFSDTARTKDIFMAAEAMQSLIDVNTVGSVNLTIGWED